MAYSNYSFILPAGTYVITDPCYVIERWDQVIADTDCFDTVGIHTLDGHVYCGIGTAYGDGSYTDNMGNSYSVDAGLIGAVSVELVKLEGKCTDYKTVKFDEPTVCGVTYEGVIYFGDIYINTSSDDNGDENYDDTGSYDDNADENEHYRS